MTEPRKPLQVWSYAAASQAVPHVRVILRELREGYIRMWHLYCVNKKGSNEDDAELETLRKKGITDLEELKRLGILAYERPSRGIALFPFVVDDVGKTLQAYFVYKDSREVIESFVFNDALCEHNDLLGNEWLVPEEWKKPGAVPKLREVLP